MSEQPTTPIQIHTTAPIPLAELKRKFTEDIQFVLDVDNSRLKGRAFLTFLVNLQINCRLEFKSTEGLIDLLVDYLQCPQLASIPDLEDLAINVLLAATGKPCALPFDPAPFIEAHQELIETWLRRLDSLPLFALYCQPDLKADVEANYPEDTDDSMVGINFVRLIEHELFPLLIDGVEESDYNWNKTYFNEYIFAGDNLFKFFASKNNPYFLGLLASQCPTEFQAILPPMQGVLEKASQMMKEIEHVSPAQ